MHWADKIYVFSACLHAGSGSAERVHGTGKDEWGHPHSAVHMAAARLGCKSNMVSTRWANSRSSRINRLRKHYSHLLGGSLLAGKAAWGFSGCLPTENADYCTLVNEWVWLSLRVRLICLKVHLGVWTSGLSKQKTRRFTARLAHIATPTQRTSLYQSLVHVLQA